MTCNGCKRRVGAVITDADDSESVRTLQLTVCGKPGLEDDNGCMSVGRTCMWWCFDCLSADGLCPDCYAREHRMPREQRVLFQGESR